MENFRITRLTAGITASGLALAAALTLPPAHATVSSSNTQAQIWFQADSAACTGAGYETAYDDNPGSGSYQVGLTRTRTLTGSGTTDRVTYTGDVDVSSLVEARTNGFALFIGSMILDALGEAAGPLVECATSRVSVSAWVEADFATTTAGWVRVDAERLQVVEGTAPNASTHASMSIFEGEDLVTAAFLGKGQNHQLLFLPAPIAAGTASLNSQLTAGPDQHTRSDLIGSVTFRPAGSPRGDAVGPRKHAVPPSRLSCATNRAAVTIRAEAERLDRPITLEITGSAPRVIRHPEAGVVRLPVAPGPKVTVKATVEGKDPVRRSYYGCQE